MRSVFVEEDPRWNDCLTAVNNTLKEKDWKIYPNPTSHEPRIEIQENEIGSFKIFDLHGKEMNIPILGSEGNYFAKVEVLKSGVYFLEWAHGNKKYHKKWIRI
ncbi:MAG: T9SS type A sorting domain-containing protein [Saprospiraceae bacterium]|nr:T9SS type A sorting domain-containing protein [Candidatus Vicinibacter affinis]